MIDHSPGHASGGASFRIENHCCSQSNKIEIKQRVYEDDGSIRETDPPDVVPADTVLVLQPYGSLFFASAPIFEAALPGVTATSRNSVVILRLRGRSDLGSTFMDVLRRYADSLRTAGSKLVIVASDRRVVAQLTTNALAPNIVEHEDVYASDEWVGRTVRRAHDEAFVWIRSNHA